ncbi:OLC1v1020507C1 [Oldenlandia corymbosa var. corymbosa]|uniref:soluble epoxide hydrolase n=1 Tax=Oldenlandia corymbosa var. corymbosa TaxID=529605 RepID=A0AAV1EGK3_OLDCO|nr:OLC1v1020507C1 [Oldenlandia corymbosa var. corymbosa]
MEGVNHKNIDVNGINMHVAEMGQGPLVLLLHGFPECWYTWRHQMVFLAANGHRAVAPDLRGFGGTTGAPVDDHSTFTSLHVVGDLIGLLNIIAPDEEKVFVVGHDWGAMIGWALCLYRPDKVKALFSMSVRFSGRNPERKPLPTLRAVYGNDYYIMRFQEHGEIEEEFAKVGTKKALHKLLTYCNPGPLYLPKGKWVEEIAENPMALPSWLTEQDLDYFTSQYEQTGFTGGLNYYRALDMNWELTAAWTGDKIKVPVKFVAGDLDLTYNAPGTKDYIHKGGFKKDVPFLEDVVVINGVGHFVHEEKPDEINKHILQFIRKHSSCSIPRCAIIYCCMLYLIEPAQNKMDKIEHKNVSVNGLNLHIAELGTGPLVLLLHGFPELWYSWRHQIVFLAAHGYRAVAPDLRGYGDTTGAPIEDSSKFSTLHLVGDVIALLQAIAPDEDKVFVVGHDWGALIAWHLCLFRPDKVKALVNLSVAFSPINPSLNIVDLARSIYGDDFYICRFQPPGEIEAEFAEMGVKYFMRKILTYRNPGPLFFPKGKGFGDSSKDPVVLPSWLTEEDVDYFASKFEKTGFTGPVNYYRAFNLTWELTAPWTGCQVKVPTKFVVGDLDLSYHTPGIQDYIHKGGFKADVPLLEEVIVIKDAAHFINQERPDEISKHIYDFIQRY